MICEFCQKEFSNKSNLNYHQKTAKYCLKKRPDMNDNLNNYKCDHCDEKFSRKYNLDKHLSSCKIKKKDDYDIHLKNIEKEYEEKIKQIKSSYESQIKTLQETINKLEKCNQELALKAIEKPTIVNNKSENNSINTTYNHLQPINLSPEHIYQVFDQNLKLEDIYKGQKGLANVVAKKLLTDENGRPLAFCNDKSRQIIKYKDENNQIIKDAKAFNLVSSIAPVAEKIALKRKKEFEDIHYPKEEVKTKPPTPKKNRKDDEDYVGFEDEDTDLEDFDDSDLEDDEINDELKDIQTEKDKDIQKQKFKEIYNRIENEKNWSQEKKDYYHNKMINGITDLQILTANCNGFTKQLSMVLPAEKKV